MPDDRNRLTALYAKYGGLVHRRARALLRDEQAARDACQDIFLKVWQAKPDLSVTSPVAWLYQVTTNHCLNVLRDGRRRRALVAEHVGGAMESAAGHGAASAAGDLPVTIAMLLRKIPEHLHELAVYYYVDEMSQDEIALVMNVPQRTISLRLKEFRELMQAAWAARVAEAS
jgi:RNA polymerase sigma-70 factor (ECF subfamily)